MSGDSSLLRGLPLLVFLCFALFWSVWAAVSGIWVAMMPSLLVGSLLLGAALRGRGEA